MVITQRRNNVFLFGIVVIIASLTLMVFALKWNEGEVRVVEREVIDLLEIDFTTYAELLGISSEELDIETWWVAMSAYHEARGDKRWWWSTAEESMTAVTYVVMNRGLAKRFPRTPKGVITQKHQFSWYWDGKDDTPYDEESFALAYKVAKKVLNKSRFEDPTHGATHYYNPKKVKETPKWARGKTPCVIIGSHHYFCDVV